MTASDRRARNVTITLVPRITRMRSHLRGGVSGVTIITNKNKFLFLFLFVKNKNCHVWNNLLLHTTRMSCRCKRPQKIKEFNERARFEK